MYRGPKLGKTFVAAGMAVAAMAGGVFATVAPAAASQTNYSKVVTVPAPPASDFTGASGGGDGWGVALSSTRLFNVFHHNGSVQVNCHEQDDASDCWANPKTVTDGSSGFSTSGTPGLFLDQATGHLFVPVARQSDGSGGVLCIDTTVPDNATGDDMYCGYTALTPPGEAGVGSATGLANPVQVGTKWWIMNPTYGSATGAQNQMLCFDLATKAACANQPFALDLAGQEFSSWGNDPVGVVGTKLFFQMGASEHYLGCFDTVAKGDCAGSWPVQTPVFAATGGSAFPMFDSTAHATGVCSPVEDSNIQVVCFDMTGAPVAVPAGMTTAIPGDLATEYNSSAVVIGPRVYVPLGDMNAVGCWDYAADAGCAGFPKVFDNLGYLYSVNADPARPDCLWVNADGGSAQIQNFNAFGGGVCGDGAIRVLTSAIVVPSDACIPASFTSLELQSPARSEYTSASVSFQDASGNPIAGASDRAVDGSGVFDLTALSLSTENALPQFLITVTNPTVPVADVQLELKWKGTSSPACEQNGVVVDSPVSPYAVVGKNGGVFDANATSLAGPGTAYPAPVVGLAYNADASGWWVATSAGDVRAFGSALHLGDLHGVRLAKPIVAIVPTTNGTGYYLIGSDGGVFTFGSAPYLGGLGGVHLAAPIVAAGADPDGTGYTMVGSDGGVFNFSSAYLGGLGAGPLQGRITSFAYTPDGSGYYLAAADGGVFTFGSAHYSGSMPGLGVKPRGSVTGIAADPDGTGYWLVGSDGGVFTFDAPFAGSAVTLMGGANPAVGIAAK